MKKSSIVKARVHHGSKSLDLTIPSALCENLKISEGDAFTVETNDDGTQLKIIYTRIFQQKTSSI